MISLVVTISNGFLQLFSLDKNYFEFALTSEQLKTEGWQFFQLAGKYEDYATHEDAYKPFSKSVENIKRKQVEKEFQGKGDVNKNKKDKDKDKDKEPVPDPKMDILLGLLGKTLGPQTGGSSQVATGVRDILTQPISSPDLERGSSEGVFPSVESEKDALKRRLQEEMA